MYLSKPDIIKCLDAGRPVIDPRPPDDDIEQVSVDLRLARGFSTNKERPHIAAIHVEPSLLKDNDLWEYHDTAELLLPPGGFVLATTHERIELPNDLLAWVEGRSTWARAGIGIHLTAPKIDPGFAGNIALEIVNLGPVGVELRSEIDAPAQLVFARISEPLHEADAYGAVPGHQYQFQDTPLGRSGGAGNR